jgi:hypothetical protein
MKRVVALWRYDGIFADGKMIINILKLAGLTENRSAGRNLICVLSCYCLMSLGLLFAQMPKAPSQSSVPTMNRVGGRRRN